MSKLIYWVNPICYNISMYLTIHAAMGGAIGQFINEPWLAFFIGFASHLLLDAIPHGDEDIIKWKLFKSDTAKMAVAASIDFAGLIIMTIYWVAGTPLAQMTGLLYGMAGAMAPDALWGFHQLTKTPLLRWYRDGHTKFHYLFTHRHLTILQGFLVQIPLLVIMTWVIAKF